MAYHRVHKIDTKIVRIFNTYGERMREDDGRAIPNFIIQALKGKPITVYGNGSQTRSFCYISDLVNGIYKLMKSTVHKPLNIGNPNEMTLLQLARLVIRLTHSKTKIVFRQLPTDDPRVRCPDIHKTRRLLHWRPRVDIENGLQQTISYFRSKYIRH